ncbi:Validoxylamine A glucosyltransferase [Baekduia alba]|uniref:glycosyltransferase family 2 protein n=1 Tax=Baekduia alba TaxID=2997333 RepID=UPI0023400D3A|nr:glycosyltransferase [Baekduia alba]WCB95810.1 Validoxylamine A glucosyltransferase [Baekduia alba]
MSTANAPLITVVAAAHNRAERVQILLDALAGQTLGTDRFDVVVVDDGSRDATPEVLARAAAAGPLALTVLTQPKAGGPAAARNRGWRTATAPVVAFTDDDCRPSPEWLATLLETLGDRDDVLVQGRTAPDPREIDGMSPFARTLDLPTQSPHYETCNIAYPRAVLERLGGFDENYPAPAGEDTDLGFRAVGDGVAPVFTPDALVFHAVHQIGPKGVLKFALRAAEDVRTYKANPELRALLPQGVFYRRTHPLLLQAALAAATTRKAPITALFALPYLMNVRGRAKAQGGGTAHMPFYVLNDVVEVAATVKGAVRYRVPIV